MAQEPNIANRIATRIRLRRDALGWSQEELADQAGFHRTYIGAVERGERNITVRTLFRIASALGCAPCHLIEDE